MMITPRQIKYRDQIGSQCVSIGILGDVDFSTWKKTETNPLKLLVPILSKTDVVIANVETVISDRELKSTKNGILLRSPVECTRMLSEAGIDVALLANNHIDDFGRDGVTDTVKHLSAVGIQCFGLVGQNDLEIEIKGVRFCLSGFGTSWQDTTVVPPYGETPGGIIRRRSPAEAHWLYFVHGFEELFSVPFPWCVDLLNAIADKLNPSAVICGHAHVYQGWMLRSGVPVCLSYGNGFMNLDYHLARNALSKIGCYSILHFDESGCFEVMEYFYRISPSGIGELGEVSINEMLETCGHLDDLEKRWEDACYNGWKPKGYRNWPIIRMLYDFHRHILRFDGSQQGIIYDRAIRAAYLKRQYGRNAFSLREDELISVV